MDEINKEPVQVACKRVEMLPNSIHTGAFGKGRVARNSKLGINQVNLTFHARTCIFIETASSLPTSIFIKFTFKR